MVPAPELDVHAFWPRSIANGPGQRAVIWLQGCTLGCPGCFNPETHARGTSGGRRPVSEVGQKILELGDTIEGITLTGGEPLQQPHGILTFLRELRARRELSIVLFSGYTHEEIGEIPEGSAILDFVDVLIDGRYIESQRIARGLRGSSNQRVHLLTSRYTLGEIEATAAGEVRIAAGGEVRVTGVRPLELTED